MKLSPFIIEFPKIGNPVDGFISVAEKQDLPFEVKRIYWTYFTPESIIRGGHAHHRLEQILIAVSGKIVVTTKCPGWKEEQLFVLESANKGLYIPRYCWHKMEYSHNAVQVCIANIDYDESEYIRDYEEFRKLDPQ